MKIKTCDSSGTNINSGSLFITLLLAGVVLLGPGWGVQRCAAQDFPPGPYSQDEVTFSMGVFQIQVDPSFAFLFAPVNPYTLYYPGFAPASDLLTSPVLYDDNTTIGTSALDTYPGNYPQTIGDPSGFGVLGNNPGNVITGFNPPSGYYAEPGSFVFGPQTGYQQVYTEIESLDLAAPVSSDSCGQDVRVPAPPNTLQIDMVMAGPNSTGAPFSPSDPNNLPRRSMGMVQQTGGAGTTAQSFFNINVTVALPAVTETATMNDFPYVSAYGFQVALLTNDPANPLVIINTNVTALPPTVVYIHGFTAPVPLYFANNNPPYWSAGDCFGYVTLAGHGVFTLCTNSLNGSTGGASNCCQSASDSGFTTMMLDETLGPVGQPRQTMPVLWSRSTNSFPTPNTSYGSIQNTVVETNGVTNILDASVSFTFGSVSVPIRDLQIGVFSNSITPPASPGSTATFSSPTVPVSFLLSNSGSWYPASGTGSVVMVVSNSGSSLSASNVVYYTSNPPQQTVYSLVLSNFNSRCTWADGPIYLQQNPTNATLGQLMIGQGTGGGYGVGSSLEANFQASTDGMNYNNASGALQLVPSLPPPTPKSIYVTKIGNKAVLQWQNNFTLQSTTNLLAPFTDVAGPVTSGSYTNPLTANTMFFRLRN